MRTYDEVINAMPEARRLKIESRTKELLFAAEAPNTEMRSAIGWRDASALSD